MHVNVVLSVSRCNISVGTTHHTCFTQGQRGAIRALHLVVVEERTARARQGFAHGIKWRSVADKEAIRSTRQGRTCDVNRRVIVQTIGTTRFQKSDPVTIVLVPLGISSTAHKAARHFGRLPMVATERFPSSRVPVKVPELLVWSAAHIAFHGSPEVQFRPKTNQRWPRQRTTFSPHTGQDGTELSCQERSVWLADSKTMAQAA